MFSAAEEEVEEGILVKALADLLKPKVMAAAIHAKQALFSAQAEDRRRRLDTLQHKIDEASTPFFCLPWVRVVNVIQLHLCYDMMLVNLLSSAADHALINLADLFEFPAVFQGT